MIAVTVGGESARQWNDDGNERPLQLRATVGRHAGQKGLVHSDDTRRSVGDQTVEACLRFGTIRHDPHLHSGEQEAALQVGR